MSIPAIDLDHRSSPRLPATAKVWLQCRRVAPGHGAELANGLLDVSAGGAQFLSTQLLTTGEMVEVSLGSAAVGRTLHLRGVVRWVVEFAGACVAGVRFEEPLGAVELHALLSEPVAASAAEAFIFEADEPIA